MYHQEVKNKKKNENFVVETWKKINRKKLLKKFIKRLSIFFFVLFLRKTKIRIEE